jgi:hypothetical protein
MKRVLLSALTVLTLVAPASAQYYGGPSYEEEWSEPAPSYRYERRPDYGYRPSPEYGYETRREYRYGEPRDGWRRQARRGQFGNVCVTSRGSCEYPQSFPLNSNCRCDIPGFGPKRGNIQY